MKYILHPKFDIMSGAAFQEKIQVQLPFDTNTLLKLQQERLYILFRTDCNKISFITPTIQAFLVAFRTPIAFKQLATHFNTNQYDDPVAALKKLETFFEDMEYREIIVSTRVANKIQVVTADTELKTGDLFHDFTILSLLSASNMKQVFLAQYTHSGEKIILKTLHIPTETLQADRKYRQSVFIQEFKLMCEVGEHPHICKIITVVPNYYYTVLEWIDGMVLKEAITKSTLQIITKHHITQQILAAVAQVHAKKIIHGDLHAKNFLITPDNVVKLIDFDFSNHSTPKRYEIIRRGGIYQYIAPEKIDINGFEMMRMAADYRSEVFQLGVLLYFLYYEKMPFYGATWHELAQNIQNYVPVLSTTTPKDEIIPESVRQFLLKSLNKDPMLRFEDAGKMWNVFLLLDNK